MQITPEIKKIIQSISWRSNKYWEFGLSRHEWEKFWLTEMKLRTIINTLLKSGYIQKVRCEYFNFLPNMIRRRNIYKVTTQFQELLQSITESIKDMNEKIIGWCKTQNPVQTLRDFGIEVFNGGRIGKKKSSITVNRKNWSIKDWKTWKTYNLYNYLRESLNCTHSYFITNFIW